MFHLKVLLNFLLMYFDAELIRGNDNHVTACAEALTRDLWLVLYSRVVELGLTLGFRFQVGSHSCRQGDSGPRGKKKPPLFHLSLCPFVIIQKSKHLELSVVTLSFTD